MTKLCQHFKRVFWYGRVGLRVFDRHDGCIFYGTHPAARKSAQARRHTAPPCLDLESVTLLNFWHHDEVMADRAPRVHAQNYPDAYHRRAIRLRLPTMLI